MWILSWQIHHGPGLWPSPSFCEIVGICQGGVYFADHEKANDCISRNKLWAGLMEYDIRGQLLAAFKSLYKQSEICVHVKGMKTKPFKCQCWTMTGLR